MPRLWQSAATLELLAAPGLRSRVRVSRRFEISWVVLTFPEWCVVLAILLEISLGYRDG
jgi:hypothetical protein